MLSKIKSRITYANVTSTLAVFIVLGGGAYAASTLPKNSVGSKQIKKNAVTSAKVKNGTLTVKDAKAGQFAVPSDLNKVLPVGGTAVNSNALGGTGPGGFVKGGGHRLSGTYNPADFTGHLVAVPGGEVAISCESDHYDVFFKRASGNSLTFDLFRSTIRDSAASSVTNGRLTPGDIDIETSETADSMATIDVSSSAGYAQVTVFAHQDSSTHDCTAVARGYSNP
jgi:hypothetical protein